MTKPIKQLSAGWVLWDNFGRHERGNRRSGARLTTFIRNITFDAEDPDRLANFWAAALEWERQGGFVVAPEGRPRLNFERVPERKVVKNRVHLDVNVDDRERKVARLIELGATKSHDVQDPDGDLSWTVMLDPEGNEFCVVDLQPL